MTFEKKVYYITSSSPSSSSYWVNLLHYREVLHYWLIFITLSGSITLSGVYYIIGAK